MLLGWLVTRKVRTAPRVKSDEGRMPACENGWVNLDWEDVRIFLAIAEEGSLSRAAKRLRVGQPTVSRRLGALEQQLGYRLFDRRVEGAVVTSAGERILSPARSMAEWAGEVARAAGQSENGVPRGVVRITAPPSVAIDFVAPFAVKVRDTYPELRLEVLSTVRVLDLARGEADIALRYQQPSTRDLVSVGSVTGPSSVVAAKSYLSRFKKKPRLEDLDWIAWAPPFEKSPPNPQLEAVVPGVKPVFTSDDFSAQWRACEAGVGAMLRGYRFSYPSSVVALDVELGPLATSTLHVICARSALSVLRIRAVAELMNVEFKSDATQPVSRH